jgi:acetolactate synthase I/II/III large subunit
MEKNHTSGYGLYRSEIDNVLSAHNDELPTRHVVRSLIEGSRRRARGLTVGVLAREGIEGFAREVAARLGRPPEEVTAAVRDVVRTACTEDLLLTGAEVVALLLREAAVRKVFAYAGTSELALCDSVARIPGIELINGRGDKESAFMAAGASLFEPAKGVALLHGARGLTNAGGALADARRNEVGTLFIVGLPSTASARFLPPHGEPGLIRIMGSFVKFWHEAEMPPEGAARDHRMNAARSFVDALRQAAWVAREQPHGPAMFGIPQDVAERAWIPWTILAREPAARTAPVVPAEELRMAASLLTAAQSPLILLDDYALRYPDARPVLAEFADLCSAPVTQVRYKRGAMLFERLTTQHVPAFAGWLEPDSPFCSALLERTDLLITIEDRNMYRRVVGELPQCRKLAINSDGSKVRKNEYLGPHDLLVEGNPIDVLRGLSERLRHHSAGPRRGSWAGSVSAERPGAPAAELKPEIRLVRTEIVRTIAAAMDTFASPVLVDDSQMFGGMISEHYDQLPAKTRVFGDHGGFVGGGIAQATGLAIADPDAGVFCVLGDQGFTNGMQGLVAAAQQKARVTFLVCNNGESVSLLKQASTRPDWFDGGRQPYLHNPGTFSYVGVAERLGIASWAVDFHIDRGLAEIEAALSDFEQTLHKAISSRGPALVEMRLPSLGSFWDGIWIVGGFDERAASGAR